jgi:hypothetical protein
MKRARAGYTLDACPGCGDKSSARPKNGVCYDCESLLKEARQARADKARDDAPVKTYTLPSRLHWHIRMGMVDASGHRLLDAFATKWLELVKLLGTLRRATYPNRDVPVLFPVGGKDPSNRDVIEMRPDLAAKINEMDAAMDAAINEVAHAERRMGSSIIASLASGSITVDQFNQYTTERKR